MLDGIFPFTKEARAFARDVLAPAIYPDRIPLEVTGRTLPGEPMAPAEAIDGPFDPFRVGDRWGGMWATTWFRFRAEVPPGRIQRRRAHLDPRPGSRPGAPPRAS